MFIKPSNYSQLRREMVERQLVARDISDARVLNAMNAVERHLFVPAGHQQSQAYEDKPLSIGHDQTISQPYMVAAMTQAAEVKPEDRVLEIGTGCGYQTAVLAEITNAVYSVERIPVLAFGAKQLLRQLGYTNVAIKIIDGFEGWAEEAPFDVIIVTAAPADIPQALLDQLKVGGRLIIPVGSNQQELYKITKKPNGFHKEPLMGVRFVPMLPGRA